MNWLLNGAFRIGRFARIDIYIHITFVIFVAFELMQDLQRGGWPGLQYAATISGMLFLSVLLHEYGHCFGARAVGGDAESIVMWPLGGLALVRAPMRPWEQFVTTAAGPAVNLVLGAICAATLMIVNRDWTVINFNPFALSVYAEPGWQKWVARFFLVNYSLFMFNMCLLMYPFDCARLVHTILWRFVGLQTATIWICQIGILFAVGFGLLGIMRNELLWVAIAVMGGMSSWHQLVAAQHGYVVEDPVTLVRPRRTGGSWWSKFTGGKRATRSAAPDENPNPGGWERKQSEAARIEAEVDRILAKVKEQGMNSLSYIERQTLERATRMRRDEDREFDQSNRL